MNQAELMEREKQFIKLNAEPHHTDVSSMSEEDINNKYLSGDVRIVTEQARYPLNTIREMFDGKKYILKPDFQRRLRWDETKQSRLIESFIMNVPIPPIFLYEADLSVYEVMDGMQRITAIKDFYEDKYSLKNLEMWPELNGKKYSELPEQIQKGIDRRYISSIVLMNETAKTKEQADILKRLVFARINSGGAKLEDQENRNSQYKGRFNNLIISLARNENFCNIFDIPQKTENENLEEDIIDDDLKENILFKSMKDVEYVLRFFAIRQINQWSDDWTLSTFLDLFSSAAQNLPEDILESYKDLFEKTIELAFNIFGDKTFCLYKVNPNTGSGRWAKKPAMVIYDPLMNVLSKYLDRSSLLVEKKDDIITHFQELICQEGLFNGRNTNPTNVKNRIEKINELFCGIVG